MWSVWSVWGPCSVSCGVGTKSRARRCDNPPPAHMGQNCVGSETDESICEDAFCPVDGGWSDWSMWTTCAVSCGVGNRTRDRTCTNPEPLHNGRKCNENSLELDSCSIKACPEVTDQQSALGPAVGGASGAILVLLMVVLLAVVILKKRKRNVTQRKNGSTNTRHLDQAEQNVLFRPEPNGKDRMYFNIESNGTHSCSDTDTDDHNGSNDIIAKSKEETNSEIVYCNFNENMFESMNIKIEELGNYIKIKKIKNELEKEYKTLKYGAQYPTTFATTKENMSKNRFKTTFPYDHTRVILQNGPNYINANYINGFEKENCYVASQGPIKSTVTDHWRMIWQLNICKIVMLTNLVEDGKRKCEKYWPDGDKHSTYGNFVLTLLSEKRRAAYVTREISMMNKTTKENRTVIQYHFTSWPDHGTPDPLYLVLFYRHASIQSALDTRPLLVHCSAGIGRTGTYIGLDALYEQGKTTGYIDVAAYVGKMRYCRMNMIQTQEQYVCLHDSLNEAFTMENTNIAKNDFGNVWREILLDKRPTNHQRLKKEFKMLEEKKKEHTKTEHAIANSPNNKDKNRNKNVLPSDTNRVYLSSFEKGRTDYINAVHAPSYTQFVGYVTTQLPLPDTKVDFWTLIRDQDSSIIVLLLKDHKEADFVYSNAKSTGSLGFNTLKITNSVEDDGMKTLSFTLSKKDDRQRNIVIYQVASDSLPEASVLCKLAHIMSTRISMTESPVIVVSSDGASRCGLFCTFINAVSSMTIDENADIFQLARLLQLRRPEFFKDYEEYKKVYEAVNNYLESSNVYANY